MFLVFNKNKLVSILIIAACVVCAISFLPNSTVETSNSVEKLLPIYNVEMEDKKIALTINCAWANDDIDQILNCLEEYNVCVTFFIVGDFAKKYPDSVKKIYSMGHELGNHSNTHPHVNNLSQQKNILQIQDCNNIINEITGVTPQLYRTPYGEYNDTVIKSAMSCNMNTIQWNIDTLDYTGLAKEEMWKRIEKGLKPGSIVLMHSGTENTAKSLPYIINNLTSMKYEIVKVSDLIYKENAYINSQGMQKLK